MIAGLLVVRGVDGDAVTGPAAPVVVAARQLVQRAEALDFGVVCGDDPPVGRPGVLPAGDPAAFEPSEQVAAGMLISRARVASHHWPGSRLPWPVRWSWSRPGRRPSPRSRADWRSRRCP